MRVGLISAAIFTLSSPVLYLLILYKEKPLFVRISSQYIYNNLKRIKYSRNRSKIDSPIDRLLRKKPFVKFLYT